MSVPDAHPSRFWSELSTEHRRALDDDGILTFKRTVALRHFSWQWHWRQMARSEQARFLVRHSGPRALTRAFTEPMELGDDAWAGVDWSRADRRLYTAAVRLIWRYATNHGDNTVLTLPEPELGAPLPVHTSGRLISQDLANSALEVASIVRALDGRVPRRIVEIGAGYGRSAYALLHRYPDATYTVVDIEPTRSLAAWYLTRVLGRDRVRFVDPADVAQLPTSGFDLALSISSLQEMTPTQVSAYMTLLDRVTDGGTVYLKQWRRWHNRADDVQFRFSELPVPSRWDRRFEQRCPVQTHFVEGAWHVGTGTGVVS